MAAVDLAPPDNLPRPRGAVSTFLISVFLTPVGGLLWIGRGRAACLCVAVVTILLIGGYLLVVLGVAMRLLVGVFLRLRPEPLAQRAGVTVRELDAWPPRPELQAYLAAVVEVLDKAIDVHRGDERRAAAWYLECAVPEFDGRTADAMVRDGRQGAVVEYLYERRDA